MTFYICFCITLRLEIGSTHLNDPHLTVLEGEKAAAAIMPGLKTKLPKLRQTPKPANER